MHEQIMTIKVASGVPLGDTLKNTFSNPKVLAALLAAAGGGGLLSGYLSSREPQRRNETPQERRMRIIRNALVGGALGTGVAGGGALGMEFLNQPRPADRITQGLRNIISPLRPDPVKGVLGAAGAGSAAWFNTKNRPRWLQQVSNMLGSGDKSTAIPIRPSELVSTFGKIDGESQGQQLRILQKLIGDQGGNIRKARGLLSDAGLPLRSYMMNDAEPGVLGWIDHVRNKLPAGRAARNLAAGGAAGFFLPPALGWLGRQFSDE